MKVDYHLHLEEGPYSFRWLQRTHQALEHFSPLGEKRHTREWLTSMHNRLDKRVIQGAFSEEWIDLYLERAVQLGLKEVGIVDHLYRFKETRKYYETHMDIGDSDLGRLQRKWLDQVMTDRMSDFTSAITEAKKRWSKKGVSLRLGIEADYFPGCETELKQLLSLQNWDYVIGSVHFLNGWGFDNPETQDAFKDADLVTLYAGHFQTVESAIRSGLFHFVAHLDNLKVFSYRPDETMLIPMYKKIAQALVEEDLASEINAGLFYRYPVQEMCPSPLFLSILVEHGVPLTLSSDAHFPDDLGKYCTENRETLRSMNVKEIATFKEGRRIMKSIDS